MIRWGDNEMSQSHEFETEQDAWDWMYEQVDDPFTDNTRFAYQDEPSSIALYEQIRQNGCCGSFDCNIVVAGRPAQIGCNYGH
jgi:hypothetical protein